VPPKIENAKNRQHQAQQANPTWPTGIPRISGKNKHIA